MILFILLIKNIKYQIFNQKIKNKKMNQESNQVKQIQIGCQLQEIVDKRLSPDIAVDEILYIKKLQIIQNNKINIKNKFGELLFENKIQIVSQEKQYANDLKIEVIQVSKDWRMFKLSIKYQQYCFSNIDMVINDFISPLHCLKHVKRGNYGNVYPIKVNQKNVAIKCIIFQDQSDFQEEFQNILKEFLFTKLASTIKAGPKILEEQLGFSMFIYHDCIEFTMELCDQINIYTQQVQVDLRDCLETLHDFKLIHYDVKLSNICYSPTYEKNILIDYGISEIAKTERHQKQLVLYRGTFAYCSDQMKKVALSKNKKQLVNLYENDKHGLNQTIHQLKKMMPLKTREPQLTFQLSNYYQYYLLISHLFNNHKKRQMRAFFKQFLKDKQKTKQYLEEIFKIIISLRYSSNIQKIFSKQKQQFSQLLHLIKETNLRLVKRKAKIICKESLGEDSTEIQYKFRIILSKYLPTKSQINQPIERLKSQDLAKTLNAQTYLLQILKYIKVESKKCTYQEKLKISTVFLKLHIKRSIEGQHQITEAVFQYFYQFCINGQITGLKVSIIQELIISFLLFELISETQYLQFFSKVLTSCRTIDKLLQSKLFIIRFLSAVEWVRYKITICKYDYQRLKQQLSTIFCEFVSKLQFKHPLIDILQLIKIMKETNNLNQSFINISALIYYHGGHQNQKPINLSNLNIKLPQQYSPQINVQNLSLEQIIGYGLKFDIQIIEDYYQKICSQIHQNQHQFQEQAKEFIFFLVCQNNTQSINQDQSFKRLNQFLLQSKQKKVVKYYFFEICLLAHKNYQIDYANYIIKFNLQTFNNYTFQDTIYLVFQTELYRLEKNQGTVQQLYKNIQTFASKYLIQNIILDWYLIDVLRLLVQVNLPNKITNRISKQFKYKFTKLSLQNWTKFQEFFTKQLLAIQKCNKEIISFQYQIGANLGRLFIISHAIQELYPDKIQLFQSFINMFDKLTLDLALPIKFQILLKFINFRLFSLYRENKQKVLFDQFINLGLFLLKLNRQKMIVVTIIGQWYLCIPQSFRRYASMFLLQCTRNNKKFYIQLFYLQHNIYNKNQKSTFIQLFLILYYNQQFQQITQIIKIIIQYVDHHSEEKQFQLTINHFNILHQNIIIKDLMYLYVIAWFPLLAWKNPFFSFYLISICMSFTFAYRLDERQIYIFICKSLDKLNRQGKNVLEKLFLCVFYQRQITSIQKLINSKRHMRKLSFMILKTQQGHIQLSKKPECFKTALNLILKPTIQFRPFYQIFFLKLQKYYRNAQYPLRKKLFDLKMKKYLSKC